MNKTVRTSAVQKKSRKNKNSRAGWIITIFFTTVIISALITRISDALLEGSGIFAALVILMIIVLIGIAFDIVGVAVTAAEEQPLHSMASKRIPGAREAISLIRNADRVASICNDVVGDICGVVSGSASAVIAVRLMEDFTLSWPSFFKVAMSAMVAGLTVGGKAIGKGIALRYSVSILHFVGRLNSGAKKIIFWKKRKKRKSSR